MMLLLATVNFLVPKEIVGSLDYKDHLECQVSRVYQVGVNVTVFLPEAAPSLKPLTRFLL